MFAHNFAILFIKIPVMTSDGMEKQIAANVAAPFLLFHLLFGALDKAGNGRIISINGFLYDEKCREVRANRYAYDKRAQKRLCELPQEKTELRDRSDAYKLFRN